ncbi:putative DDE superfamily endonuclease [Monocercomonoides exilis]|uniref:putative DDE superfamily endonuclease n=1 Tax=Monocercomonoides exilis TaxID=2049356 RepID=UPI0035596CA3|nr:putative DDE superfamily endonuclease [Monocercomonoides exilis]|eukprot:MONOS_1274.1-p1 / transcript=MONOS_1274.1 / gene=MONOS_1274 / organism=Monocercomonoides_exilis_PA203 / gene_product=unspecified product / transcript_product=unspecified product / location=Mono_scaffold00022:17619-19355(+) / protein_length=430 / sequence_SO=supercontig / SO=protein_coding / is_pseudo=false
MTGFTKSEPDRIRGTEEVALVFDCSVFPVNKTGKEFNCGSDCFSGKHKIYCVKVEVGVNPKTGTASTVSKVHGGAVHDYVVFREHYSQFAARLDGGKIMADSAYVGAKSELGAIITKPVGTPELAAHRVNVERFFGRLKTLFTIFRRPWPLKISSIAEYFYVACCLTNYHILQNPLSEADFEANQLFLSDLIAKVEEKRQKKELANEKYRARLLNRLNPSSIPTSRVTSLHALEDSDVSTEQEIQINEKNSKTSGDQKVVTTLNEDTRIPSISESDEASANSSSVIFPPMQNLSSSLNETSSSSTTQQASSTSPQPLTTILISDQTTPSHSSELQSSQETFMNEGVTSTNTSHLTSSPPSIFSLPSTSSTIETHPSFRSSQPTLGKQKIFKFIIATTISQSGTINAFKEKDLSSFIHPSSFFHSVYSNRT